MASILDSWDLSPPVVPPRARFYPLEPIGVGTPLVEGLTGYLLRLAEAHAVPVAALTEELRRCAPVALVASAGPEKDHACPCGLLSYSANGVEESAAKWAHALNTATHRSDLEHLTLLAFEGFLCSLSLFRRFRTWCSACFEEWRTSGTSVYEPLLWSLTVAAVCPYHRQPFVRVCPRCGRPMRPIMSLSRPGYCGRCGGWLGTMPARARREETSATAPEYWVSKTAGDLLALAPQVTGQPGTLRMAFRDNIDSCVRHLFNGNGAGLAKFAGCTATSVYNWRNGKTTPRIDQLLQLSERLRISIAAFLLSGAGSGTVDWKTIKPEAANYTIPAVLHRSRAKMRQALRRVLNERPAPRLSEVARRLGYRGTEGLRRVSRSLCKRITDNYRKSSEAEPYYYGPRRRICGRQEIEAALKAALANDEPESVPRIARRLGYAGSAPFFGPFPGLCRAINLRIARYKVARIRSMRRIVVRAVRQNPPPTLRSLALRLGYKDKRVLTRYFAGLCSELLARRRALAKSQIAQLRREVQSYTRMEPAPSMAEVCRKLGLKPLTASRKFPAEYKLIVSRYQRRRRTLAGLRVYIEDCGLRVRQPTGITVLTNSLPADQP